MSKTRAEWLQEAMLLEQMGGEWEVGHAAAFCTVSESFIRRSDCPKLEKQDRRGIAARSIFSFGRRFLRGEV